MAQSKLRSLERKLVFQRAETLVMSLTYDFVVEWERVDQPDPLAMAQDLYKRLEADGIQLPGFIRLHNYLAKCIRNGNAPERRSLVGVLLPWVTWS